MSSKSPNSKNNKDVEWKCHHVDCNVVCKTKAGLTKHTLSHAKKDSEKKKVTQTFKCHHCDFTGKSKAGLTSHVKAKHDGMTTGIGGKLNEKHANALTPPQESFCMYYASDREMFGNGVQSYIEAYDIEVVNKPNPKSPNYHKQKTYNACKVAAHQLLTSKNILKRINEIYEGRGLNDVFVDKQLEFIITQKAELRTSLGGVQEYNKLKKRTSETVEHVHAYSDIKGMSDEELAAEKKKLQDFFQKK